MKEQNKRPDKLPTCELGGAAARGASSVREHGPLQPDGTCPGSFSSSRPDGICVPGSGRPFGRALGTAGLPLTGSVISS